jgi:hypothetical protein
VDANFHKAMPEGLDLNDFAAPDPVFSDLNLLQHATMIGDVWCFEGLVACGAACGRIAIQRETDRLGALQVRIATALQRVPCGQRCR